MIGYERHIFVCENMRSEDHPKGSCGAKGGAAVRARFRQLLHEHGLAGRVRANLAGCLDRCEQGVTVVVYPEGVWYGRVTVADVDEIFASHILAGKVVERCRMAPAPRGSGGA